MGCSRVGGTWGALATGLFATVAANSAGANGFFYGNPQQLLIQVVGVGSSWLYSFVMTCVILKVIDIAIGLRVKPEEEEQGLDISHHGEPAYADEEDDLEEVAPKIVNLVVGDSDRDLIAEMIRSRGSISFDVSSGKISEQMSEIQASSLRGDPDVALKT